MAGKDKDMPPISTEEVEVDGVYTNEWGREIFLRRGEPFPFDPQMGTSEWRLSQYVFDDHHQGRTDERLIQKEDGPRKQQKLESPLRHSEQE